MQRETYEKIQKYLPSKKFSILIGGIGGGILLILIISSHLGTKTIFDKNPKTKAPVSSEGTLGEIVTRDSNNNGISDWEESLWGLDPKADGAENKKIIDAKKAAANIKPDPNGTETTATDTFSQELLSTILALRQSGSLTPETVTKVAQSVGDSLDKKHVAATAYTLSDMKIVASATITTKTAYKNALKKVIAKYANVPFGSEQTIIASGLEDGGVGVLQKLTPIAAAYSDLGNQIIALPTPRAIAQNALDLANASAQMGAALVQVQNIYTDTITGMVSLDDYIKASAASDRATTTLAAYFAN